MRLSFADVQRNVSEIANRQSYSVDVLYELMAAYGRSASSITKLRNGIINLAEDKQKTVLQRGVVYLKDVGSTESLPAEIEKLEQDPLTARYNPRFLIATDFKTFAAKDTKKGNTLEIAWEDIDRNVDFFYGWTGDEVTDEKTEAVADRRAADKMKELYYEIEKINRDKLAEKGSTFRHDLNVFFTRLLFCFFAEDTKVFSKENQSIFTNAIKDYTQTDGSDLNEFLNTMFDALDSEDKSRFTSPFSNFPYVNGTLFDTTRNIAIPKFNAQARKYILDCGSLNWAEINPDIFGSMFQSIVDEDHRAAHGQHYTSVPNIMKTIEPLFLDELREEFDKYYDNNTKLAKLHNRISKIKVFDPACGSGNFLIIAYKELRKLEHAIIEKLYEDDIKKVALAGRLSTRIDLDNFYGIEIDDFACEVAALSLYLAKHQMNIEFEKQFGKEIKLIPLKDKANIVRGNAAQLDWQEVCPNTEHTTEVHKANEQSALIEFEDEQSELELGQKYWDEIYLISNPPYLGSRNQDKSQKEDMAAVLSSVKNYKILDYITIWFYKGANYIKDSAAKLAFVSTNSITQGDQVATFWPNILNDLEIGFAYSSFKWSNNAKNSAGVTVIVIGLQPKSSGVKTLIHQGIAKRVNHINAYLAESSDIYVSRQSKPLNGLPKMSYGNYTGGCESLILEESDKDLILKSYPQASKLIRQLVGSAELIRGTRRYCLWISNEDLDHAKSIPEIAERIATVAEVRSDSKDPSMQKLASRPHQFRDFKTAEKHTLVVPIVFSERREYLSCGILPSEIIVPNSAQAIYDAPVWVFGVVSSSMHMVWVKALSGRMRTDIRYSSAILYNNFPLPLLTDNNKHELIKSSRGILFTRENHAEKTLAEMYDPNKMPKDLREAHHQNDLLVDRLYRQKPYENDEERLADLFELYEAMIEKKGNKNE
jgi:type I restriction-modification system DNA methylase subunit